MTKRQSCEIFTVLVWLIKTANSFVDIICSGWLINSGEESHVSAIISLTIDYSCSFENANTPDNNANTSDNNANTPDNNANNDICPCTTSNVKQLRKVAIFSNNKNYHEL